MLADTFLRNSQGVQRFVGFFYLDCVFGCWLAGQTNSDHMIILTDCMAITFNLHVHVLLQIIFQIYWYLDIPKLRGEAFPFLTHVCKDMVFFASRFLQSLILYELQVVKKWQTLHIHLPLMVKRISLSVKWKYSCSHLHCSFLLLIALFVFWYQNLCWERKRSLCCYSDSSSKRQDSYSQVGTGAALHIHFNIQSHGTCTALHTVLL